MRFLILLILVGCATQLTESEQIDREYKLQTTFEEWKFCQKIYAKAGVVWYSTRHRSSRRKDIRPSYLDMRMDMGWNNCDTILRKVGYK